MTSSHRLVLERLRVEVNCLMLIDAFTSRIAAHPAKGSNIAGLIATSSREGQLVRRVVLLLTIGRDVGDLQCINGRRLITTVPTRLHKALEVALPVAKEC